MNERISSGDPKRSDIFQRYIQDNIQLVELLQREHQHKIISPWGNDALYERV